MRKYFCFVLENEISINTEEMGYSKTILGEMCSDKREKGKIPLKIAKTEREMRARNCVVIPKSYVGVPTARKMKEQGTYALLSVDDMKRNMVTVERNIRVLEKMGVPILIGFETERNIRAPRDVIATMVLTGMGKVNAIAGLSWRWEEVCLKYIHA